MTYTIAPLTPHTGAEVRGLDLNRGVDPETRRALNRAFVDSHVLVIRDQQFTPPQFIAAARIFGELFQHDKREMHVPGYPEMYYVSNEQTVPGKRYISGETFHTDHSNHPAPPKATLLFPVSLPKAGGDTQYVNMHLAYDDLPAAMKARIDGLKAVHVYLSKYSPRELRPLSAESSRQVPAPGVHPLVRTHPENGRKALYLNPVRIEAIDGMEDADALALVDQLMTHAIQPKYEYRHQWHYGDMVIWDNRSVIHKANPDYDMNQRRYLYRLMLKGESPV
jgi:alpha-ketoglutarate-dependent taurine dioxygenase